MPFFPTQSQQFVRLYSVHPLYMQGCPHWSIIYEVILQNCEWYTDKTFVIFIRIPIYPSKNGRLLNLPGLMQSDFAHPILLLTLSYTTNCPRSEISASIRWTWSDADIATRKNPIFLVLKKHLLRRVGKMDNRKASILRSSCWWFEFDLGNVKLTSLVRLRSSLSSIDGTFNSLKDGFKLL